MSKYHLAQINIGKLIAPLDDPSIAGFVNQLDEINTLAEGSEGFIWRLTDEEGNATSFQISADPQLIVNMSVWTSIETLRAFAFQSRHVEVMRQRRNWFVPMSTAYQALWWIPVGHRPSLEEAKQKLDLLEQQGPSPAAFDFRKAFPAPE